MMSDEDKDLLETNRPNLMQHIDLQGSPLLAELRARKVITGQNQGVIKAEAGNDNQVGMLLDILLKRDERAMDYFIYALRKSGHAAVAATYLRSPYQGDII